MTAVFAIQSLPCVAIYLLEKLFAALLLQVIPDSFRQILMDLIRDMSSIIPEILIDRQTAIRRIVRCNVRRIISRAVACGVFDSVWCRIIQYSGQKSVGIKDHGFCVWM